MIGLIGFATIFLAIISRRTTEMAATSHRLILKSGLVSRRTIELNLSKIEGLGVSQGIFGRILGYGTVSVGGTGGSRETFKWVADPLAFRRAVSDLIPR